MLRRSLPLLLGALSAIAGACATAPRPSAPPPPEDVLAVIAEHRTRYPRMDAEDVYKIVWQSLCGPAFVPMGQESGLDATLAREVADLRPSPFPDPDDEPLFDPLAPSRNWVRLNLRPFLLRGGTVWELGRIVAQSSRTIRGNRELVGAAMEEVARAVEEGRLDLPVATEELRALARRRAREGFPPGRHSRAYVETYAPAYRVVLVDLLDPTLLEVPRRTEPRPGS